MIYKSFFEKDISRLLRLSVRRMKIRNETELFRRNIDGNERKNFFHYKLFNIDVLNDITADVESEGKFENHYRLCSFYRTAFNQAPLSRQLTGRSMQLKAIVTSVCVRAAATMRLGINVPALEQTDRTTRLAGFQ